MEPTYEATAFKTHTCRHTYYFQHKITLLPLNDFYKIQKLIINIITNINNPISRKLQVLASSAHVFLNSCIFFSKFDWTYLSIFF